MKEVSNKEDAKCKLSKHLKNLAVKKKPYAAESGDKKNPFGDRLHG